MNMVPVSVADPPDLSRFKQVVYKKSTQSSAPFTLNPPTTDDSVSKAEVRHSLRRFAPGIWKASLRSGSRASIKVTAQAGLNQESEVLAGRRKARFIQASAMMPRSGNADQVAVEEISEEP